MPALISFELFFEFRAKEVNKLINENQGLICKINI